VQGIAMETPEYMRTAGPIVLVLLLLTSCGVRRTYTEPGGPVYEGEHCDVQTEFCGTLRVVTYNVALSERVALAIEEFREIPELSGADIILLQEMDSEGAAAIAESLGCDYVYYPSVVHAKHGRDFGTAVLTRWQIASHRKLVLPYQDPIRRSRRAITVTEVAVGGHRVLVSSVHTETAWMSIDRRVAQADSLVRSLVGDHPFAIVGGDFNTFSWEALEMLDGMFQRAGFYRATTGVGSTAEWGPLHIFELELDHIYVRGFNVLEGGKVREAHASDHKPVWVVLEMIPEG
jgi:endonuclease/exonuclease/phosphatase family metal-dependent hydrolase